MLYLLLDHIVDENNDPKRILKIGYSDKKFVESRGKSYNTCNYGYELIREIEGTLEDETNMHKRFKHLLLPGSREWFEYSDEIVEEFYSGWDPGDDIEEALISISPITMRDLERDYLNDIVDQDLLLGGSIKSIYRRIELTVEEVRNIWKRLLSDESVEEIEDYVKEKLIASENLIGFWEDTTRPEHKDAIIKLCKDLRDIDFFKNYVLVIDSDLGYEVKLDEGSLKIDQLALEAYKKELAKREKLKSL